MSWGSRLKCSTVASVPRPRTKCVPDVLEFNLKSAKAKDPEVRVQLQADNGVNYGEVARAMAY